MQTLTYGFFKPQNGDKGSVFWSALEANFQQLNDHTHNGTDSPQLAAASFGSTVQLLPASGWTTIDAATSVYRQLVTLPGALQFDDVHILFFINSGGDSGYQFYPTLQKVSSSTYYIFANNATIDVKAVYK